MGPTKFLNAKTITAYCSLDPSLKISAQKVRSIKKRKGNKALYSSLCMSTSIVITRHSEFFGRLRYRIYYQTSKWERATNVVARGFSTALFFMHMNVEPFTYEKYHLANEVHVLDMPLDDLVQLNSSFYQYIPVLKSKGIFRTRPLIQSYYACELRGCKGLIPKFYTW